MKIWFKHLQKIFCVSLDNSDECLYSQINKPFSKIISSVEWIAQSSDSKQE